jgi:formylglycine-generating enzyme required for sulfatase activity
MQTAEHIASDIPVPALPDRPYPGLRPFTPDEDAVFFGREPIIDEIIDLLAQRCLILVHGSSGSGKSSLVLAGVLPRLARHHRRHGWRWRTARMRPGGGPLWNLARALAELEGGTPSPARVDELRLKFDRTGADLAEIVAHLPGMEQERLCLLVDQFEELFRYARETSREVSRVFVDLITSVLKEDSSSPVRVILTMRSEFLGECARMPGLAAIVNKAQYLLPRMERGSLQRAICRPAEVYGGKVTSELADRLIADVRGSQDELPLIQHGLMRLWDLAGDAADESQAPRRLDLPLYEAYGPLARLLDQYAEGIAVDAGRDVSGRRVVEDVFRALTDTNADGQAIRRPQSVRSLIAVTGAEPWRVMSILDAFRSDRVSFLTPYAPASLDNEKTIDISHEALIRCWNSLAAAPDGWLHREFRDGLIWRSLLSQADLFEKDRRNVLGPVTTQDRENWLKCRTPAWCKRYGGGWSRVQRLMMASRREQKVHWVMRRLAQAMGAVIIITVLQIVFHVWVKSNNESATWAMGWSALFTRGWLLFHQPPEPEMVPIRGGEFMMGSRDEAESLRHPEESPRHPVTVHAFEMGKYDVTFEEYDVFANATLREKPSDRGWGRQRRPVINVSWEDARAYTKWLNEMTGKTYRLPSEAEWEYAARADTHTMYWWGDEINKSGDSPHCNGCGSEHDGSETVSVGSFAANPWGLYDTAGNVWQWTADCWHKSYEHAPSDGSAWTNTDGGDCKSRVVRGGSWTGPAYDRRSAERLQNGVNAAASDQGFRLAKEPSPCLSETCASGREKGGARPRMR